MKIPDIVKAEFGKEMQEERGHKTNETTKYKLKNNIYELSD